MKEKLFAGICLLVRLITWGALLLVVIAIATPDAPELLVMQ